MVAALAPALAAHCDARDTTTVRGKVRCRRCGHRITVNGIPPAQTRDLMLARPSAGVVIAVTELVDRTRARHARPVDDEEA